jgi:hypothetical protein
MKITTEELPNKMWQGKAIEERCADLTSKTHETLITWKILSLIRIIDQAQKVMHLVEEEGEEDPRNSQITTQDVHTYTANIMEEVIALKGA